MIRPVEPKDASRISEIYSEYIIDSPVSFELEPPSAAEMQLRMANITAKYPWLVYEVDGVVAGYAYGSTHRTRPAYNWSVEVTVYLDSKFHGRGIGRSLYEKLFELLRDQGFVTAFAGITLPNEASVGIHEAMGFKSIGVFKNIGFKLGKWWDVGWWQLPLQNTAAPKAIKPPLLSKF